MAFGIPDLLSREIRHRMECVQDGIKRLQLRTWINNNQGLVLGVTIVSVLLLAVVLVPVFRSTPAPAFVQTKTVWFYDMNAGKLFLSSGRDIGPIAAPSGPAPGGEPAGFRAHVYSYVLDPKESDLFVGFLEKPDLDSAAGKLSSDMRDFERWSRGRLIKRVRDKQWVPAASPQGQAIVQEILRPNKKGQTPMYQMPKE
jgi:hypothetical protein